MFFIFHVLYSNYLLEANLIHWSFSM